MQKLSRQDRLSLMKFVCSFAWADLEIKDAERKFVRSMIKKLQLDEEEAAQVQRWLQTPPRPEEIDPTDVPQEHRKLFLETVRALVAADGEISADERENLALFDQLLPR
jgi:uncharacterized tellurite resistance protein B-like protein